MKIKFTAFTRSLFLCTVLSIPAMAVPFGVAANHNVFILGNITQSNSDIEGRVAVGGNAQFSNFNIGSALTVDPARHDLIVGGNLSYTNAQLANGSGIYAGTGTISGVGTPHGSLSKGASTIDFSAAGAYLMAESESYAGLGGVNGALAYGGLTLNGASSGLNVFYVSSGILAGLNNLRISAPSGSTVLINVAGTANSFKNAGMSVTGTTQDKVLFNFFETTSLVISGAGITGSILAPEAAFSFSNGQINGQVIAGSLTGSGESHNRLFTGSLPLPPSGNLVSGDVPEPATWCIVGGALILLGLGRRRG